MEFTDAWIPLIASIITIILTKGFDSIMAKRQREEAKIMSSLSAVDEISGASVETIQYLRTEINRLKEENLKIREECLVKDQIILGLSRKLAEVDGNGKAEEE